MSSLRNFPEGYGVGASKNPCSEVYQGPRPLSEVEAVTIRNHIRDTENILAAVSIHSYGNVIIYPWGYKVSGNGNQVCSDANIQFPSIHYIKKCALK